MFGNLPRFIYYGITNYQNSSQNLLEPLRSQLLVNFLGDNVGPIEYLRSIGPKQ